MDCNVFDQNSHPKCTSLVCRLTPEMISYTVQRQCVQVEKHREDLQHKHTREMERLRDASVRLKDEYEHKMELEK